MGLLSTVRNVAGGRLPPATRFAVLCGFGVFVVGLLIFKPVSGGAPAAKPLTAGAVLLPPGNALAETQGNWTAFDASIDAARVAVVAQRKSLEEAKAALAQRSKE
jgi:hypothetical protein